MFRCVSICAGIAIVGALTGCQSYSYSGGVHVGSGPSGGSSYPDSRDTYGHTGQPTSNGTKVAHLGIPPGHLPPPGMSRIWFPGNPPGKQPPSGSYAAMRYEVPPGAWLITRPVDYPNHVIIQDYTGMPTGSYDQGKDKGHGKGRGKNKGAKGHNSRGGQVHGGSPDAPRQSEVSAEVILTPEDSRVGVRVYDADTGIYVGAEVPIG